MTKPDDDCDARAELSRIRGIADELLEIPHDTNAKLAVLIPVDGSGQVSGNPVVACCHETTDGEVRVWCRTKFQARYALLEPLSESLNFAAAHIEVVRCDAVGSLYELRGQFIDLPVDEFESHEQK